MIVVVPSAVMYYVWVWLFCIEQKENIVKMLAVNKHYSKCILTVIIIIIIKSV